jgi:uncharacterized delta-60 repeat protein
MRQSRSGLIRRSPACARVLAGVLMFAPAAAAVAQAEFVATIALQTDGKAVIGGTFASIDGIACHDLCRLNADGNVDTGFADINADGAWFTNVYTVAVTADSKILVSGVNAPTAPGATLQSHVLRLNADGSIDATFVDPNPDGAVLALAVQADGKVWAGGSFVAIAGTARSNLARLDTDGSIDAAAADTSADDMVRALALRSDGELWVAGNFSTLGAQTYHALALLDVDGGPDAAYIDANLNADVWAIAAPPNQNPWIGGDFSIADGQARHFVARLDGVGGLDASVPDLGIAQNVALAPVMALAEHADGRVDIGGSFLSVAGQPLAYLARVNPQGDLDASFVAPSLDGFVFTLAVQQDGKLWVGGNFLTSIGHAHSHIARLNADGSADQNFADPDHVFGNGFE